MEKSGMQSWRLEMKGRTSGMAFNYQSNREDFTLHGQRLLKTAKNLNY